MPPLDPNQFPPPFSTGVNTASGFTQGAQQAPAFTQQQVDLSNLLAQNVQTLAMMTDQLLHNLDGMGDLFDRNSKSVDRMGRSYEKISKSAKDQLDYAQQQHEVEKRRDALLTKIQKAEGDAAKGKIDSLRQQFRLGEMLDKQGKIQYAEGNNLKSISVQDYLTAPEQQRQAIRSQLSERRATHSSPTARLSEMIGALGRGDFAGAASEALQPTAFAGRLTEPLMRRGEALAGRGGLLGSIGSFGIETAIPFLASPAALYGVQRYVRQGLRTYQNDLRQGMQGGLTGPGAALETGRSQIRARVEGINPFDALTTGMALEIARGIQSEGFTGPIRAAWQDSVTDVVKSTGMDASQALQLMATSANTLGQTANQFRSDMGLVQLTAAKTSISISAAAKSFQDMQVAFFARGGAASTQPSGILASTLSTTLPRNVVLGGRLTGAIAQNWQQLVARAGINPALAFEPQIIAQATKVLDSIAAMFWRIKNANAIWKNMPLDQWVTYMEAASPGLFEALLPGTQNADIVALMREGKNGGFAKAQQNALADQARAASPRVAHHRGFLGSIIHGGSDAITGAIRTVGSGLDYPGRVFGRGVKGTAASLGIGHADLLGSIAQNIFAPGTPLEMIPKTSDVSVAAMRKEQIKFWRSQSDGLTAAQQRELLAPVMAANSVDALNRAATAAQTILIKLDPNAHRIFTAEPANVQRYYDQTKGRSTTQGMVRPVR